MIPHLISVSSDHQFAEYFEHKFYQNQFCQFMVNSWLEGLDEDEFLKCRSRGRNYVVFASSHVNFLHRYTLNNLL